MADFEILLEAPRFRVVRQSYCTPDGTRHVRDIVQHPGAVVIVPMVGQDRVCLIQNYRRAVDQTLIELPAGTLEPDEDPLETAFRELREETGFTARSIEPLHTFYMSPGILDERMHLYVATDLEPGETNLEAGEQIENLVVGFDEALAMVHDGRIQDAKTLVGLLYWDRARRKA